MNTSPLLLILAGANGSGKTSFYNVIKFNNSDIANMPFVNPDIITDNLYQQFYGHNIDNSRELRTKLELKAGKIAILTRNNLIKAKNSFIVETTASSSRILQFINKAKQFDYIVNVYFFMLKDPRLNIFRVNDRVKKGGHYVEPEAILRRYERAKNLLVDICMLANEFTLIDNSSFYNCIFRKDLTGRYYYQQDCYLFDFLYTQFKSKNINISSIV